MERAVLIAKGQIITADDLMIGSKPSIADEQFNGKDLEWQLQSLRRIIYNRLWNKIAESNRDGSQFEDPEDLFHGD